ncbi:uncharacterized protein [Narcine bancroftii]|uniref:uncharacterized protein isoform X3 n=1 Tax=Narcine bancroftii TaxID=1343680 RepID=UPI003832188D
MSAWLAGKGHSSINGRQYCTEMGGNWNTQEKSMQTQEERTNRAGFKPKSLALAKHYPSIHADHKAGTEFSPRHVDTEIGAEPKEEPHCDCAGLPNEPRKLSRNVASCIQREFLLESSSETSKLDPSGDVGRATRTTPNAVEPDAWTQSLANKCKHAMHLPHHPINLCYTFKELCCFARTLCSTQ